MRDNYAINLLLLDLPWALQQHTNIKALIIANFLETFMLVAQILNRQKLKRQ